MNSNDYLIMNVISNLCVYVILILVVYLVFKVNNNADKLDDLYNKYVITNKMPLLKHRLRKKVHHKQQEQRNVMTEDNLKGETQTYVPIIRCNKQRNPKTIT